MEVKAWMNRAGLGGLWSVGRCMLCVLLFVVIAMELQAREVKPNPRLMECNTVRQRGPGQDQEKGSIND